MLIFKRNAPAQVEAESTPEVIRQPILAEVKTLQPPNREYTAPVEAQLFKKLGEHFIEAGLVTAVQLNLALQLQTTQSLYTPLGEILVEQGYISEQQLSDMMARLTTGHATAEFDSENIKQILRGLGAKENYIDAALKRAAVMPDESLPLIMRDFGLMPGERVAEAISRLTGKQYFSADHIDRIDIASMQQAGVTMRKFRGWAPVGFDKNGGLQVALPDVQVYNITNALNEFKAFRPEIIIASEFTIQTVYRRYFADTEKEFDEALNNLLQLAEKEWDERPGLITDIIGTVLKHACYLGASDIFLNCTDRVGIIRLKVEGVGKFFRSLPMNIYLRLINRLLMDNAPNRDDLRHAPQEASIKFQSEADMKKYAEVFDRYRFRMQLSIPEEGKPDHVTAVVRILDSQSNVTDFDKLGFDVNTTSTLRRYINSSTGLVLVTGPTGSGKTTSLYAMLKEIDPIERSIQSIENPIEYRNGSWIQNAARRGENEGDEAKKWLKALLRMAPDVILMGEVRDAEIGHILLQAANTGHLVFSTLHANSATLALIRLRDLEVDRDTLASVLLGILAQRLVRTLCADCKETDERMETLSEIKLTGLDGATVKPYRASVKGCINCGYRGYRGRHIIYELLDVNAHVREMIETGQPPSAIAKAAIKRGHSMWACGMRAVAQGLTSLEEVTRVAMRDDHTVTN